MSDLLRGAAAGDERSWEALVERFGGLVWSVARSYNLDHASVEDVNQTVWLRLAEHCGRIESPERLVGWLGTTTRNEALRVLRCRQRVEARADTGDLLPSSGPSTDEPLLAAETLEEVLRGFAHLEAECQQLLRLLCAVPRLDYKSISELTGRPTGSIGPTRQRCLEKLRKHLPRAAGDEIEGDRR